MNYYAGPTPANREAAPRSGAWRRTRPLTDDQRTPHLFWLTVLALGCVSMFCVTWGASLALAKKDVGKSLQAHLLLPKLNSSHGERKALPVHDAHRPVPVVMEHSRDLEPMSFQLATQEPPQGALELPFEMCHDPIVYLQPCTPNRGDSPMIHTWKTLTLYSLLTAGTIMYVPQPVLGQEQPPKKDFPALDDLSAKVQELTRRLGTLENKKLPAVDQDVLAEVIKAEFKKIENGTLADLNRKLQGVGEDLQLVKSGVNTLKIEMDSVKETQLKQKLQFNTHKILIDQLAEELQLLQKKIRVADSSPATTVPAVDKTSLDEIRNRLNTIQDTLARLSPTEKRLSMSMPGNNTTTNTGRVMLVNLYSDDLLFIINGVGYNVPARSSRALDNIPVGSLRYEVFSTRFGVLDNKTTNLTNGETFTLTASR